MKPRTFLIGISGASGSGKSYLTRKLLRTLNGSVAVDSLCEDAYYRAQDELSFSERTEANYDHPEALEHELLATHLQSIAEGKPVQIPVYDYGQHTRSEQSRLIPAANIIIVEGILIFHLPQLRQLFDLKIFVHTDLETCLSRRIIRDTRERDRTPESVIAQFESSVRPMFHRFVEPTIPHADLVVSGDEEIAATAATVLRALEKATANTGDEQTL